MLAGDPSRPRTDSTVSSPTTPTPTVPHLDSPTCHSPLHLPDARTAPNRGMDWSQQPDKIYDKGSTSSLPACWNEKVKRTLNLVLAGAGCSQVKVSLHPSKNNKPASGSLQQVICRARLPPSPRPLEGQNQRCTNTLETQELFSVSLNNSQSKHVSPIHLQHPTSCSPLKKI